MPDSPYPWNDLYASVDTAATTTSRISDIEEALRRLSVRIDEFNEQYVKEQINAFADIRDIQIGQRPEIPEWRIEDADIHGDSISATAYALQAEEAVRKARRKRKSKTPEEIQDPPTLADDFIDACLR